MENMENILKKAGESMKEAEDEYDKGQLHLMHSVNLKAVYKGLEALYYQNKVMIELLKDYSKNKK